MHRTRIFLIVLLIGGAITAWVILSTHTQEPSPETSQAQGVALSGYDKDGNAAWHVTAKTGQMEGNNGTLSDVSLNFFSDDKTALAGTCDSLTFSGDKATLYGNVIIEEGDGVRLATASATWSEATRDITAENVDITLQSASITAPSFVYALDKGQVSLSGGVHAELAKPSSLTVDGDTASESNGLIAVTGNVKVKMTDGDFYCPHLEYDSNSGDSRLSGGVTGSVAAGTIEAGTITVSQEAIVAGDGVHVRLNDSFFGGSNGS